MNWRKEGHVSPLHRESPMLGIVNPFFSTTSTTSQANGPCFLAFFLLLVYQPADEPSQDPFRFFFATVVSPIFLERDKQ